MSAVSSSVPRTEALEVRINVFIFISYLLPNYRNGDFNIPYRMRGPEDGVQGAKNVRRTSVANGIQYMLSDNGMQSFLHIVDIDPQRYTVYRVYCMHNKLLRRIEQTH